MLLKRSWRSWMMHGTRAYRCGAQRCDTERYAMLNAYKTYTLTHHPYKTQYICICAMCGASSSCDAQPRLMRAWQWWPWWSTPYPPTPPNLVVVDDVVPTLAYSMRMHDEAVVMCMHNVYYKLLCTRGWCGVVSLVHRPILCSHRGRSQKVHQLSRTETPRDT